MPKCSDSCQYPQLPVDTSPHFCPVCTNRFHALCSQSKYINADKQGLTFANSILCPSCVIKNPHLVVPGSPTLFESPEPAQRQEEVPESQDEVHQTRSSERIRKQREHGLAPKYSFLVREVSVPTKLFDASQLTTTSSVIAETQETLLEVAQPEMTQPSIQSKNSNKILISRVPQGLEVLNATASGVASASIIVNTSATSKIAIWLFVIIAQIQYMFYAVLIC
jgi:hypothetical protein